jgi:hypothetical protein
VLPQCRSFDFRFGFLWEEAYELASAEVREAQPLGKAKCFTSWAADDLLTFAVGGQPTSCLLQTILTRAFVCGKAFLR